MTNRLSNFGMCFVVRYSGLGVRSVGPVGDFLECWIYPPTQKMPVINKGLGLGYPIS